MSKQVLLIADDDEMNRMIIKKFLADSFELLEAENGRQAIDIMASQHVDLLLLDIIMPELDGLEVLKMIRDEHLCEDMGILVATSTKEKTEREALSLGADDIVSKPYDPVVIRKRLSNILASKEIQKQQKMLLEDEIQSVIEIKLNHIKEQVIEETQKLHQMASIITKNKDNEKLVVEMAEDIQASVKQIDKVLED